MLYDRRKPSHLQLPKQGCMDEFSVTFIVNAEVPASKHLVCELSKLIVTHKYTRTESFCRTAIKLNAQRATK